MWYCNTAFLFLLCVTQTICQDGYIKTSSASSATQEENLIISPSLPKHSSDLNKNFETKIEQPNPEEQQRIKKTEESAVPCTEKKTHYTKPIEPETIGLQPKQSKPLNQNYNPPNGWYTQPHPIPIRTRFNEPIPISQPQVYHRNFPAHYLANPHIQNQQYFSNNQQQWSDRISYSYQNQYQYQPTPSIPKTSFSCQNKPFIPGMYADIETNCEVYHVCFEDRHESFFCGKGTRFNQSILTCDHAGKVNCKESQAYWNANAELGKAPQRSSYNWQNSPDLYSASLPKQISHSFLPRRPLPEQGPLAHEWSSQTDKRFPTSNNPKLNTVPLHNSEYQSNSQSNSPNSNSGIETWKSNPNIGQVQSMQMVPLQASFLKPIMLEKPAYFNPMTNSMTNPIHPMAMSSAFPNSQRQTLEKKGPQFLLQSPAIASRNMANNKHSVNEFNINESKPIKNGQEQV